MCWGRVALGEGFEEQCSPSKCLSGIDRAPPSRRSIYAAPQNSRHALALAKNLPKHFWPRCPLLALQIALLILIENRRSRL